MLFKMMTLIKPEVLRLVAEAGKIEVRDDAGNQLPFRVYTRTEWFSMVARLPEEYDDDADVLLDLLGDVIEVALPEPELRRIAA